MNGALFAEVSAAQASRTPVVLVTCLNDGLQALIGERDASGPLVLPAPILEEARRRLTTGISGPLEGDAGLFARVYAPAHRLLIVGAVHIAQALAPMAVLAGFAVTVIDPRQAFATAERFPGVVLSHEWPDEALARLAPDRRTAVVTLSHDPKIDDPALISALPGPAFYVGALGSRTTHTRRVARLTQQGLGEEIARLRAPVGLRLHGRSAGEIAVAVIAEIIMVRYEAVGV